MEIQQLKTFCAVARRLSFNGAARQLHYAQSSVSAQIQSLEGSLGVQLFDRLGRHIRLTEAGEHLLQYAEKILDLTEETRAEVTNAKEPKGALTIRVPETFCVHRLPPAIATFHSRFPQVRLHFTTCAHEGLKEDLRKGIVDLAFLLTDTMQAADLDVEALGFESIVLIAAPDHPLASRSVVHTADLNGETFLFSRVDCSYRKSFQQVLDHEKVIPGSTMEFNSVNALKQCVIQGTGISILPEIAVADEIDQGRLVRLPWMEEKLEMASLMIWYKERWLSPSLNAFMAITREYFKGAMPKKIRRNGSG